MEIGDVCGRKNNREFALSVVKKSVKSRETLIEMYYLCFDEFVQWWYAVPSFGRSYSARDIHVMEVGK